VGVGIQEASVVALVVEVVMEILVVVVVQILYFQDVLSVPHQEVVMVVVPQ